ncbi:hypothetical protein VE04_01055 [Pseudogymnoascus sp. 24MN13]|nr:hypothetical protein VE04_01058 [Pseudogymnoascus sp. 24MN13]OBT58055.1 hypothetical protein VE04_01055 [Pseudogymnoascus sp. 24MN13]
MAAIDVLTSTASDVGTALAEGRINSQEVVQLYYNQIERHNKHGLKFNAVISVPSLKKLLEVAKQLDEERADGHIRSALHGIPILLKDGITTGPFWECPTSCGAFALKDAIAMDDAELVKRLVDAGMIIIGKANLSELSGSKGYDIKTGWSAVGGQTQSPYVIGGYDQNDSSLNGHSSPGGSSSGSGVGVAAGFAPLSIGAEVEGSMVVPADRASLYCVKATVGLLPFHGIFPLTKSTDSVGPMAKSPKDVALVLDVLLPGKNFGENLTGSWKGLRVGFVEPKTWASGPGMTKPSESYSEQYPREYNAAVDKIEAAGAKVVRNIPLRRFSDEDSDNFDKVTWHDYAPELAEFLKLFENPLVKSIHELIDFNLQHADIALPPPAFTGQEQLEDAVKNPISDDDYAEAIASLRKNNKDGGIDKVIADYDIDVLLGPPTGRLATISAVSGYPIATVPLGYATFNGRAFGLALTAQSGREDLLIRVMSAWESTFGPRKPPPQLVKPEESL